MAEVINLNDKYIDASSIYDVNKTRTQQQFNYDIDNHLSSLDSSVYDLSSYRIAPGCKWSGWNDGWDNYKSLMEFCRHKSGLYGSAYFKNALDNVPATWFFFISIPHRIGSDQGDNSDYNLLLIIPFWSTEIYRISYSCGTYTVRSI